MPSPDVQGACLDTITEVATAAFWNYLFAGLNWVGAVAFGWGAFIIAPLFRKNFKVLPNPFLLRLCRFLAPKPVMMLLTIGGFHLVISLLALSPNHTFYPLATLLLAIPYGLMIYAVLNGKGMGMPLGYRLKLTVERPPRLDMPLSPLVLCFHVDGDFRKHREDMTDLIIEAVNRTRAFSADYDFVMKSWFFANRKARKERRIPIVRKLMKRIGITAWACIAVHGAVFAAYCLSEDFVGLWALACLISALLLAGALIALWMRGAMKVMKRISPDHEKFPVETSAQVLAKDIFAEVRGYCVKFAG